MRTSYTRTFEPGRVHLTQWSITYVSSAMAGWLRSKEIVPQYPPYVSHLPGNRLGCTAERYNSIIKFGEKYL